MKLLSSQGEALDSATLFLHLTVTNLNDAVAVSLFKLGLVILTDYDKLNDLLIIRVHSTE